MRTGLAATMVLACALPMAACTSRSTDVTTSVPQLSSIPASSTSAQTTASSRTTTATTSATPSPPPNPSGLTDQQMVGQLFVSYAYGSSASATSGAQRQANLDLYQAATPAAVVSKWHLGGVILIGVNNLDPARPDLWSGNVDNAAQIRALTAGLQAAARKDSGQPLLIATDQEGGNVQRITDGVDQRPSQADIANNSVQQLTCDYHHLGTQLRALGVNQDYAPVADVRVVGSQVIGNRSFGSEPGLVATDTTAAVHGLQSAGVLATLKHWPGHGDVSADSHVTLPVIPRSVADWRAIDRVPFQAAGATAASIMVGWLALPSVDATGTAAPYSSKLVDGALRTDLHYQGLVVTDSLWMEPAKAAGTAGQAAIRAINAGVDMLLMSPDVPHAWTDVLKVVQSNPQFRAKVQKAVTRILAAKQRLAKPPVLPSGC